MMTTTTTTTTTTTAALTDSAIDYRNPMLAAEHEQEPTFYGLSATAWLKVAVVSALMIATFRFNLLRLWLKTNPINGEPNWRHAVCVPLIGLYFLYVHRDDLLKEKAYTAWSGLGILLLGLLLFAYGIYPGQNDFIKDFGMVVTLFGVVTLLCGWRVMRIAWFPIVFLICALPWPELVYSYVASPLQRLAASVAVGTLRLFNVEAINSGTKIIINARGNEWRTLNVAEACAGLRSLMTFISVGAAIAFLSARPLWQKIVVTASAVPIAVFCNVMRVTGQGFLDKWNHELSEGFAHQFAGIVMLIPGFFLLLLVGWLLDQVFVEVADERAERLKKRKAATQVSKGSDWVMPARASSTAPATEAPPAAAPAVSAAAATAAAAAAPAPPAATGGMAMVVDDGEDVMAQLKATAPAPAAPAKPPIKTPAPAVAKAAAPTAARPAAVPAAALPQQQQRRAAPGAKPGAPVARPAASPAGAQAPRPRARPAGQPATATAKPAAPATAAAAAQKLAGPVGIPTHPAIKPPAAAGTPQPGAPAPVARPAAPAPGAAPKTGVAPTAARPAAGAPGAAPPRVVAKPAVPGPATVSGATPPAAAAKPAVAAAPVPPRPPAAVPDAKPAAPKPAAPAATPPPRPAQSQAPEGK